MSCLKTGWSEVRLVPRGAVVNLAGQFYERITDEERDPLTVTAFAVESDGECAVFCSCDLESVARPVLDEVRRLLRGRVDFPLDRIMINAIHTHTGPSYATKSDSISGLAVLNRFRPADVEYRELVSDGQERENYFGGEEAFDYISARIAEAVEKAWTSRKPSKIASGFGRAAVGMCRRVCYDDGSAKMWGDTNTANFTELEGGNDSGIELLFVADENEKLTGVVANLACPAQTLEHRSFMSADFWGMVKERLRREYGEELFLLALCSAAGDQCPRDMVRWVEPETPINDPNIVRESVTERVADPSMFDVSGCRVVARRIATEILYAYEERTPYADALPLRHEVIDLDLPLRRVTVAERDLAQAEIERFFKEVKGEINFRDNARMHVHAGTLARYEQQQTTDLCRIEVHVLRLGDVAFATNPYELFLDYGNQIRARSLAKQTFLIQLCCGSEGYLPTAKAERGSHYSAYVSSGTVGHAGGELLVRKTVSTINEMWRTI